MTRYLFMFTVLLTLPFAFGDTPKDAPPPKSGIPPAAPASPAATGPPRIKRLTVRSAEIQDLLRLIATQTGVNMITSPDVVGRVTVSLGEMDLEQALEAILSSYGYGFELRATTYIIRRARPIDPTIPVVSVEAAEKSGQILLTLSAQNSDIRRVIAEIGKQSKRNLVSDPAVMGVIAMQLDRVPLDRALQMIATAQGLRVEERDGFTFISRLPPPDTKPPLPPALNVKVEAGLLSIDLREVDPREALLQIGEQSGLNLVITPRW